MAIIKKGIGSHVIVYDNTESWFSIGELDDSCAQILSYSEMKRLKEEVDKYFGEDTASYPIEDQIRGMAYKVAAIIGSKLSEGTVHTEFVDDEGTMIARFFVKSNAPDAYGCAPLELPIVADICKYLDGVPHKPVNSYIKDSTIVIEWQL